MNAQEAPRMPGRHQTAPSMQPTIQEDGKLDVTSLCKVSQSAAAQLGILANNLIQSVL